MKHNRISRGSAPLSLIPKGSWVALGVTWIIWAINAFDREVILRLGPVISQHFKLSPEQWGTITRDITHCCFAYERQTRCGVEESSFPGASGNRL